MNRVHLKRGRARPLWHGHPWVFAQAVSRVDGSPADGDIVSVVDDEGRTVGSGFFSGCSQIRVRLLAAEEMAADDRLLLKRLERAVRLRGQTLGLPSPETDGYRLVHGEGDGLPGLIVDVYGQNLAVQLLSAGMKRREGLLLDGLEELLSPRCIVEIAVPDVQRLEGFTAATAAVRGEPEQPPWLIHEHGLVFACDPLRGQKTGYYFDQRENRRAVAALARGRRVLDGYAYSGAFACAAARAGAAQVVAVESSRAAVALAAENARRNELDIEVVHADMARYLREAFARGERFDLVILDPPKFAPRAETTGDALRAHRALNAGALALIEEGILVSASCSHRVGEAELGRALAEGAKLAARQLQVLEIRFQGPDHPWPAACPEARYLTVFICQVSRR